MTDQTPIRTAHLDPQGNLLSDDERDRRLMRLKIKHPHAEYVLGKVATFRRMAKHALEGISLAVPGRSGSGKSQLILRLRREILKESADAAGLVASETGIATPDGDWRPVLFVPTPANVRIMTLASAILTALGDENPEYGVEGEKTARVRRKLQEQKVRIILFDEFQHLVEGRTDNFGFKAGDWLKSILNEADGSVPVPIEQRTGYFVHAVFFGRPSITTLFAQNGQFCRRNRGVAHLKAFDWIDEAERAKFQMTLRGIDQALPFPEWSGLADDAFALDIHRATDGVIGRIMPLLQGAGMEALVAGSPRISQQLASDTFDFLEVAKGTDDFEPRENPWRMKQKMPGDPVGPPPDLSRKTRMKGKPRKNDPDFRKA